MSYPEDEFKPKAPKSSKSRSRKHFPFFQLPTELRLRIYEMLLISPDRVLNLDPTNFRLVLPRLPCFLVSRRMHEEAYRTFYGEHVVGMFPEPGRFFDKKPLLTRLGPRNRGAITTLELRLGPGWTKPARYQNTEKSLGLQDCVSLRMLKILVQIDPGDDIFHGFRGKGNDKNTYNLYCVKLLNGILEQVPSLKTIELDAWAGVDKGSPLIFALANEVQKAGKRLVWGPLRGWNEKEDCGRIGLESALAGLRL